jgi:peptidoglycan/LPS O-acetylase OafA/YrhL
MKRLWNSLLAIEDRTVAALNRRVDQRISLMVGSVLVVLGIGDLTEPIHVRVGFYGTVAQIIPVLMLVAAVEGRYFRQREGDPPLDRFIQRGLWLAGLMGIAASLAVIARGSDSVLLRGAVIYSLALVGVLVSAYAIYGPARDPGKAPP